MDRPTNRQNDNKDFIIWGALGWHPLKGVNPSRQESLSGTQLLVGKLGHWWRHSNTDNSSKRLLKKSYSQYDFIYLFIHPQSVLLAFNQLDKDL